MRSSAATLTLYVSASKGFSRIDIDTNESDPSTSLAGQLMGLPLKPLQVSDLLDSSLVFSVAIPYALIYLISRRRERCGV